MTEDTDYYRLFEVSESVSAEALKQAYRRLVRTCHPDHHRGDLDAEERFKSVQEAYAVLSDPDLRQAYDRRRIDPFARLAGGAAVFPRDLDSILGTRADVEAQVRLTFDQALRGGTTEVRVPGGEAVRLGVPVGVRSGLKVRVRGQGCDDGRGGRGDLYVTFRVDPSPRFRREGEDLHLAETISALEAIVGTTRQITNAYGQTMKVHIPPGTQPGERLRLRGQGVATKRRTGDLFVEVQVTVPRSLTEVQRAALERAAREAGLL